MADESTGPLGLPFIVGIVVVISITAWYSRVDPLLDAIPTVGYSNPILSYLTAFRFLYLDCTPTLKEAYKKTKPGLFKFAILKRWVVVPSGMKLIEDVRKAPDEVLSNHEPLREFFQIGYTLDFTKDLYHVDVTRTTLSRNTSAIFDQIHDELVDALREYIPTSGDEWVKVPVMPAIQRIVGRIGGRMLVGPSLCRNREYQEVALSSAINILKTAMLVQLCPRPLKLIVSRIVTKLPSEIRRTKELIRPIVEERLAKMEEFGGKWDDAPSDLLMGLINEAKGPAKTLEDLTQRLLVLNFGAVHTTAFTFVYLLYRLMANPEYIEPLRQEVEVAIAEEGWTKNGIDKMNKIDSFIRESQRIDSLFTWGASRLALRPFTFSNGVTIPAGTLVSLPMYPIHVDEDIYPNAEKFDGYRFLKLREESSNMAAKHQMVTASIELLSFGYGRHACPGRYFATYELKALLAQILITYDVKLEEGKALPRGRFMGQSYIPEMADLLFRKRQK
ncbi:cytochrome P450 [Russula dissimulans]|nr:cytochrome P450 [Russula dissimulans]